MIKLIVSASALAALVNVAEAAPQCAPGKFYRVTQKVCVEKETAVRAGWYASRQTRAKASTQPLLARLEPVKTRRAARVGQPQAGVVEDVRPTRVEENTGARAAGKPSRPVVAADTPRAIILSPVKTVIGSATSPFGPLLDPWRSDRINAPPETLFSLRLSLEP